MWIGKINRVNFIPSPYARVCSIHFDKEEYELAPSLKSAMAIYKKDSNRILKKSAVSSIKMKGDTDKNRHDEPSTSSQPEKKKQRRQSVSLRKKRVAEAVEDAENACSSVVCMDVEPDIEAILLAASPATPTEQSATREIGIQCNLIGDILLHSDGKDVVNTDNDTDSESDDLYECPSSGLSSDSEPDGDTDAEEDDGSLSTAIQGKKRPHKDYDLFFVFWDCLKPLFRLCSKCGESVLEIQQSTKASTLIVTTKCKNMHICKWRSQPCNNKFGVGTIKIATSIYCTGMSFKKMESFAETLNALVMSETTFYDIVRRFITPAIKHTWTEKKQEHIHEINDKCDGEGVWVSGDGQFDSPGYSAKYCTFTITIVKTSKIIDFIVVQKGIITGELEKPACDALLTRLLEYGIDIKLFLSDRHRGIRKMISEKYSAINHEFDVWHVCKSLGKSLEKNITRKECTGTGGVEVQCIEPPVVVVDDLRGK